MRPYKEVAFRPLPPLKGKRTMLQWVTLGFQGAIGVRRIVCHEYARPVRLRPSTLSLRETRLYMRALVVRGYPARPAPPAIPCVLVPHLRITAIRDRSLAYRGLYNDDRARDAPRYKIIILL
ncbi:MAG: hypothetical protein ACMUIL_08325 [bacterium]